MSASPLIDQYAADVRRRQGAQSATARAQVRKMARRAAADIAQDVPDIDDVQLGAVLLRAAGFAHNVARANPGATVRELAALFDAAGEWLYHHGGGEAECGEADD